MMLVFILHSSKTEDFSQHLLNNAECLIYCPPPFDLTCLTVTNNHVYRKQAIETGAMYLDLFSTSTNKKSAETLPLPLLQQQQQQQHQQQPRRV